jgi:hypothetical protein
VDTAGRIWEGDSVQLATKEVRLTPNSCRISVFGWRLSLDDVFRQEPALAMMLSLYVTLGIFLLLAARNLCNWIWLVFFRIRTNKGRAVCLVPRANLGISSL